MLFNILGLETTTLITCHYKRWNHECITGNVHVFTYADFGILYKGFHCDVSRSTYCGDHIHALSALRSTCSGHQWCTITASETEFQQNCLSHIEYLVFKYTCFPGRTNSSSSPFVSFLKFYSLIVWNII